LAAYHPFRPRVGQEGHSESILNCADECHQHPGVFS
jgi:hypothetical protein